MLETSCSFSKLENVVNISGIVKLPKSCFQRFYFRLVAFFFHVLPLAEIMTSSLLRSMTTDPNWIAPMLWDSEGLFMDWWFWWCLLAEIFYVYVVLGGLFKPWFQGNEAVKMETIPEKHIFKNEKNR